MIYLVTYQPLSQLHLFELFELLTRFKEESSLLGYKEKLSTINIIYRAIVTYLYAIQFLLYYILQYTIFITNNFNLYLT